VESEVSRVQLSHDPREHDDPLLDGLLALCMLHQKPASAAMLTTGLPLPKQRLSAELLPRAAASRRAAGAPAAAQAGRDSGHCHAGLLLLKEGRSAVLLGWEGDNEARLLLSESDGGEVQVSRELLADDYSGRVFFAQPQHKFDVNHGTLIPRARSWFRDTLKRSRWLYADAIAASLVINLIAMAAPLFVMNVYDRVVPNQATSTLWVLAIGIAAPTFRPDPQEPAQPVPGPGRQENRPDHLGDAVRAHRRHGDEVPPGAGRQLCAEHP
jgi:ATP-binding cassette subfamily C protein LapB